MRQNKGSGDEPVPSPVCAEYVGRLMGQLTCEEVVTLQDWEAVARSPAQYKWCVGMLVVLLQCTL